jgi:hypothetical protein
MKRQNLLHYESETSSEYPPGTLFQNKNRPNRTELDQCCRACLSESCYYRRVLLDSLASLGNLLKRVQQRV